MDVALVPARLKIAALVAAACAAAVALLVLAGGDKGQRASATAASSPVAKVPTAAAKPPQAVPEAKAKPLRSHPKVVVAVPPGQAPPTDPTNVPSNSRPPSDAEVRGELTAFREHLTGYGVARGPASQARSDGTAVAPLEAPDVVATVIAAGNEIATKPYKWGGGHGAWKDSGYDCSGSVSFALAGAGLLDRPLTSGGLMRYGKPGPGRWITIYANAGHTFMVVAGLRFDTSGAQGGTRWQPPDGRSYAGFTARHPPGL
jgi:cell wall-associated NlpC family hydrolase